MTASIIFAQAVIMTICIIRHYADRKQTAYIIPSGTEEYHYTKDGEEKSGVQFKFVMEFPNKKFTGKKK